MRTTTKYPATAAQYDLWLNQQMYPDLPIHSISSYDRIEGQLDPEIFLQANHTVLDANHISGIFMTSYEGELYNEVQEPTRQGISYIDLSNYANPEHEAKNRIQQIFQKPLDVYAQPLYQIALLKCNTECWYWMVRFHHIINDGWGNSLYMQQVRSEYQCLSNGVESDNTAKPSFLEAIENQQAYLLGKRIEHDRAYWKDRLRGHSGYSNYSSVQHRRAGLSSVKRMITNFDHSLLEGLYRFAEEEGVNSQNVFLAIIYLITRRRNGSDDQILGIPNLGRSGKTEKSTFGMFVNMQPFRINPEDERMSFSSLTKTIKRLSLKDYRAHKLPFREIYELSDAARLEHDLYEIIFSHHKQDYSSDFGTAKGQKFVHSYGVQKAPLSIYIRELGEGQPINLDIAYHGTLFSEYEIQFMSQQFLRLLGQLDAMKEQPIGDIEVLTEEEQRTALSFVTARKDLQNHTSVTELFAEQAKQHSDEIAVNDKAVSLTYAELNLLSDNVAAHLLERNLQGRRIGILVNRSAYLPVFLLGILKAGCTYVPLDSRYPQRRISYMVKDAGISTIIADSEFYDKFDREQISEILDPKTILQESADDQNLPHVSPDDIAYVIYTSGSTGQPKGVQVTHSNVTQLLLASQQKFEFNSDDVWCLFHSYAFDFSVWEIFGALLQGHRLVIVPDEATRNPAAFAELLTRQKITILNQTPSAFQYLIPEFVQSNTTGDLRYIIFGGEKLVPAQLSDWVSAFGAVKPALINMYGITETTVHVTWHQLNEGEFTANRSISNIGKPLPHLDIVLLNAKGELAPVGQQAELYVGGGGVSNGYLNKAEHTTERFIPHPFKKDEFMYRTGDSGRFLPDGSLEFINRIDRQVQVRGFRVETAEVEQAMLSHSDISNAFVTTYKSSETQLLAYVRLHQANSISEYDVRQHLATLIPDYMIPTHLFIVPNWPLTVNGKLNTSSLPKPKNEAMSLAVSNNHDLSRQVAEIWQQVLEVEDVSPNANFFDSGGNSLKMIKLQQILQKKLNTQVTLVDLYKYPNLHKLVDFLDDSRSGQDEHTRADNHARRRPERRKVAAGIRSRRNANR